MIRRPLRASARHAHTEVPAAPPAGVPAPVAAGTSPRLSLSVPAEAARGGLSPAVVAASASTSTDMPLRGGGEPQDGGPGQHAPAGRSGALIPAEASPARKGNAAPPPSATGPGSAVAAPGATTAPSAAPASTPAREGAGAKPDTYLELLAALEQALAQVEAEQAADRELARVAFVPDTPEKVAWLMRLLFELQERAARILAAAEARVRALEYDIRRLGYAYAAPLREHLRRELAQVRGRRNPKSVRLEEGTLGTRAVAGTGGLQITDPATARAHAETTDDPTAPALGEWVTRYALDERRYLARAAEAFSATAELLPGVSWVAAAEVLYVHSDLRDARGNRVMKQLPLARIVTDDRGERIEGAAGASLEIDDQEG